MRRSPIISTWDLTKAYGKITAIDSLYMEVMTGETYGLLGLSGSGRTTAIHLLLGLKRPTRGRAEVLGFDTLRQSYEIRRRAGCLLGRLNVYEDLKGEEFLNLCSNIRGVRDNPGQKMAQRLELDTKRQVQSYSRSERQRLAMVQALMHDPSVLFLDDPVTDLDAPSKEVIYALLEEEKARGKTILLSTDSTSEAARLCDRVGILSHGRLIHVQDMPELRRRLGRRLRLTFKEEVNLEEFITEDVAVISHGGREWVVAVKGEMVSLVQRLSAAPLQDIAWMEGVVEDTLSGMLHNEIPNPYL